MRAYHDLGLAALQALWRRRADALDNAVFAVYCCPAVVRLGPSEPCPEHGQALDVSSCMTAFGLPDEQVETGVSLQDATVVWTGGRL